MAFLTQDQINDIGFKYVGKNVKISEKASIYNPDRIQIGDNSRIDDFCIISGTLIIGRNVHIATFCNVVGGEPGITLEDFSGLAFGCHVFTQSDSYAGDALTNPTVPQRYRKETKKPILIKKHSIVGTNSIIFPGVILAEGTSVGANSMVTKSTKEWTIYFGNPAKIIRSRKQDALRLEKEYLESEEKR